jgi:hypothetical protein
VSTRAGCDIVALVRGHQRAREELSSMLTEDDRLAVVEAYRSAVVEKRDSTGAYLAATEALHRRRPELPRRSAATEVVRIVMWKSATRPD